MRKILATGCGLLALLFAGGAGAESAKAAFGAVTSPSASAAESIGSYAAGCLAGAAELPETAEGWQAMHLSRNRNWGHPEAIAFIERLSAEARRVGWGRLLVGDISQPRGGPMISGHRSHQIGLDIDIWLRPGNGRALSRSERERIGSPSMVRADRMSVTDAWTPVHHALIKAAASDPGVARIFVNAAIKQALCTAEPAGNRAWLRRVRPWWAHESHFHVRLDCPEGASACEAQEPIPAGDGCGETLAWWFTDEALNPKPPVEPSAPSEISLADLPADCRSVLAQ